MIPNIIKDSITYKKFSSYLELKSNVEIPKIQRNLSLTRVDLMRQHIREYASKGKEPIFGTLDLVSIEGINKLYVCDGQHRLIALQQEFEFNKFLIPIHCLIYNVSTYEEMEQIFITRNSGVAVPEYYLDIKNKLENKTELVKDIEQYLSNIPTFSHSNTRRPMINITNFINTLTKSKIFGLLSSISDFHKILEYINMESANIVENMSEIQLKRYGISQRMLEVWRANAVYVGYDLNFTYFSETENITKFEEILSK